LEILAVLTGAVAGCLGALVGIGGGVLLVPLLNGFFGLPFREAAAVSLVGVLGTAAGAAAAKSNRQLVNPRLAITLLAFSVSGAVIATFAVPYFSERVREITFGVTSAVIATTMLLRVNKRNVLPPGEHDLGILGARIHDADTGADVEYRVKRLPIAMAVAHVAGMLATFIGIGGGILIVPTLNSMCGVPMRAAAATSVLMIGVTAVPGVATYWRLGFLGDFQLAALVTLGVLAGFKVGTAIGPRAKVFWLKILLAAILTGVAVQYLFLRAL
jgi:uncharacterized membrane protein YfcA